MLVSVHGGTPKSTPNTIILVIGTPQNGTPNFRNLHVELRGCLSQLLHGLDSKV